MTVFIEEALLARRRMSYQTQSGPATMVDIVTSAIGWEQRTMVAAWPRHKFSVTVKNTSDHIGQLRTAFLVCRGPVTGFRLSDPGDYTTASNGRDAAAGTDQSLGLGDGVTASFDLYKRYSFGGVIIARRIAKPVPGRVLIAANGVPMPAGWTLDPLRGRIAFTSPPAVGVGLTWGGQFDVPVRFDVSPDSSGWRALMQVFSDYEVSDLQVDLIEIVADQAIAEAGL